MPYIDHVILNNTRYELQAHPYNYLLDGADLSSVFANVAAFRAAVASGDFSRIHVGDYWPVTLSGAFRDYGAYTVPAGTAYFTDAALTTPGGTTSTAVEGQYESATAVRCSVSGADAYCAVSDCLPYFERTLSSTVVNLEVAGINNYWNYGDAGALASGAPHVTFVSRDCLPIALRMRKNRSVWEDPSETNPWRGSALFKTLNDPDHGIISLIAATDIGAHVYAGPNGDGMRTLLGTGQVQATAWTWTGRGKLFLPFEPEIWGQAVWSDTGYGMACNLQYPIFAGTRRHISKRLGQWRNSWWAASNYYERIFCLVSASATPNTGFADAANGVPICFVMT